MVRGVLSLRSWLFSPGGSAEKGSVWSGVPGPCVGCEKRALMEGENGDMVVIGVKWAGSDLRGEGMLTPRILEIFLGWL